MKTKQSRPELSPLGQALAQFGRGLEEGGYRKSTQDQYIPICRKFGDYLARQGIALVDVHGDHVEAFLIAATAGRKLREGGRRTRRFWRRPITLFLSQLRDDGMVSPVALPAEILGPGLTEYLSFLRQHRGFRERTVDRSRLHVGRFLANVEARADADLQRITIEQIDRYLIHASRLLGRQSMGAVCASLRGFFGHLHMRGILHSDLRAQVSTPRIYALEGMPRAVAWSEIARTLATIDRSTEIGCRDYAMLALIAYCGLRAGDVAALQLEHIDWRHDTIHAPRPKTGASENVPLVPAVGEALLDYVRWRPQSPHRKVFLKVHAPITPLADVVISGRARFYLRRAGVKARRLGSHTLRHSFAVELLQRGHSLKAIGDVLGHSHAASTFIYAKADIQHLREVALDVVEVLS